MKRLVILAMLLMLVGIVSAQDEGGDDAPFVVSPELQEQIDQIEANTVTLRELDPLREVNLDFPLREEAIEFITGELYEALPDEDLADVGAFYAAFDFLPVDYDIRGSFIELLGQQVAGFYDPETNSMNVIMMSGRRPTTALPVLDRIIYAHEYVHALQDQYFDLTTFYEELDEDTQGDALLARQALVEGDASFIQNEYLVQETEANPIGTLFQVGIAAAQNPAVLAVPPGTPQIFQDELLFPYVDGALFVTQLFRDGGWERVNGAYEQPPLSTEHIYHPEKYLSYEQPITVELENLVDQLGEGWVQADEGTFGEFYLRQYLGTQLDSDVVDTAATGWGGDYYRIYRTDDGDLAWHMQIAWDSDTDADEFIEAIVDFRDLRFPTPVMDIPCTSDETLTLSMCISEANGEIVIAVAPDVDQAITLLGDVEFQMP